MRTRVFTSPPFACPPDLSRAVPQSCVFTQRRRSSRSSTPARSVTRGSTGLLGLPRAPRGGVPAAWAPRCEECRRVFSSDPAPSSPQGRWTSQMPVAARPGRARPTQTAYLVPGYPNTRSRAQGPFRRTFACLRASGRGSRGASGREGTRILGLQGKSHLFEHERGHPTYPCNTGFTTPGIHPLPPLRHGSRGGVGRGRGRDRMPSPSLDQPPTLNPS